MQCPIYHTTIREPLCGPDRFTYEKEYITKWLATTDTSPMTRIPMTMQNMRENKALNELIQAMNEFNIGNSLMKRVNEVLETKVNKPIIETLSKAEKNKKKKSNKGLIIISRKMLLMH